MKPWYGRHDMRCESVPDPQIEEGRDAIIKVTACGVLIIGCCTNSGVLAAAQASGG